MPSDKSFKWSRAIARESTGGKSTDRYSGLDASYYGNTGHVAVLPAEDLQAFNRFTGEIAAGLAPETAIERQLAHFYAACQWRMNRAAALEDTLFGLGTIGGNPEQLKNQDPIVQNAFSHAGTFRGMADVFEKIGLYSQSLANQSSEVLRQLKQFQAERKAQLADVSKAAVGIA